MRVIYALPTRQHRSLCALLTPSPSQPWFSHPAIGVHMCFALQALWQFFSNLPACYRVTAPPGVSFSQTDSVLLLLAQPSLPPKSPSPSAWVCLLCAPGALRSCCLQQMPRAQLAGTLCSFALCAGSGPSRQLTAPVHSLRGPCLSTDIPSAQTQKCWGIYTTPQKRT